MPCHGSNNRARSKSARFHSTEFIKLADCERPIGCWSASSQESEEVYWQDFHKKYYNTYADEYIRLTKQSDKLPKIHDLSDIYENYNEDFWNNSCNEF